MRFILRLVPIAIIIVLFFRISGATLTLPTQMFNAASKHTPSGAPVIQLQNHAPNFIELATRLIDGKPLVTSETKTIISIPAQQILSEQEAQKKAAQFKAYYQKSEKCLSPIDHDTRVACGNKHIRAKAKFEELYQQGKL